VLQENPLLRKETGEDITILRNLVSTKIPFFAQTAKLKLRKCGTFVDKIL
jgi:hypothetical protein